MVTRTLSVEDRISRQRVALMRDDRFIAIAGLMATGKVTVSDNPNITAATNGRDEVYGRSFVAELSDAQLRLLIAHETYHKLLQHRKVWKVLSKKNHTLANMAMDYVINGMLDNAAGARADNYVEFIPGGCLDHKYDGLDTLQVYKLLEKDGEGGGQPTDEHSFGDNIDELEPLTSEEEVALERAIDASIRQGAILAGRAGGKLSREFNALLESATPWQEVLRDFTTTHAAGRDLSTWRRPSRRWLARDMYMPSQYSESTKRITIGIDTSGSIGQRDLQVFLSECKAAFETAAPEIVDVIYWDADMQAHECYEGAAISSFEHSTKPKGGGGTRVGSMREYMIRECIKPDCIIVFTDGYVETGWGGSDWPAPVLWGVTVKDNIAPHGKTLYIKL